MSADGTVAVCQGDPWDPGHCTSFEILILPIDRFKVPDEALCPVGGITRAD
jgi:hypothetical protein